MVLLFKKNYFLFLLIFVAACAKEADEIVPYAYVNFSLNVDRDADFWSLKSSGGFAKVTGGALNNGIIIYRTGGTFYAYDRTCPYDPGKGVINIEKGNSSIAKDPICGSEFSMPLGGQVQKGPSIRPLKQYQVSYNEISGDVFIFN